MIVDSSFWLMTEGKAAMQAKIGKTVALLTCQ
jgi:hypothetical protein